MRTMKRQQLLMVAEKKLSDLVASNDTESAHATADEILVSLLRKLVGAEADLVIAAYERVRKWYA